MTGYQKYVVTTVKSILRVTGTGGSSSNQETGTEVWEEIGGAVVISRPITTTKFKWLSRKVKAIWKDHDLTIKQELMVRSTLPDIGVTLDWLTDHNISTKIAVWYGTAERWYLEVEFKLPTEPK